MVEELQALVWQSVGWLDDGILQGPSNPVTS